MKKIFILLLTGIMVRSASAQSGSFVISYPIGFPMSDLKEYVDKTSWRGLSLEFYKMVKPGLEVGLEGSMNLFYKREDLKTYTEETVSISGIQYRHTDAFPILASVRYHKFGSKAVSPYVGGGIGVLYVNRWTDFGLYRISNDAWQFCLRPELGFTIGLNDQISAMVGAKYNAAFKTEDLDGQSYLSLNVGLVFWKGKAVYK
jgi:hypothetical protein